MPVKEKVSLNYAQCPEHTVLVHVQTFVTMAWDGGEQPSSFPACFTPGTGLETEWALMPLWMLWRTDKSLPLPETNP